MQLKRIYSIKLLSSLDFEKSTCKLREGSMIRSKTQVQSHSYTYSKLKLVDIY